MERTLEAIKAKCAIDQDGCWIWNGGTSYGKPRAIFDDKSCLVRRVSFELAGKMPKRGAPVVFAKCEKDLCVSPECMAKKSHKQALGEAAERGVYSASASPAKRFRAALKSNAVLNAEQVKVIRSMTCSHKEIAEKFGVNKATIGRIRRGETWKNYSASVFNPAMLAR